MTTRQVALGLGLAAATAMDAAAQGLLRLSTGRGELATELRADRRGYSRGANMHETSAREWLRIPMQGALPLPQLFSYTLVLRPMIGQQSGTGLPQPYATRSLGADLAVSILQGKFGGLNAFTTRQQGSAEGGLGGESFYATRGRGATVRLVTRFLPLTFDFNDRRTADSWQAAFDDVPFERKERLRVRRFTAAGSKTAIHVERLDFDDQRGFTTFASTTAALNHRARWGRGSALETSLETATRAGYDPFRRRAWTERLQLQHTARVASVWHVHTRSSTTFGVPSSGNGAGGLLRVDLSRAVAASMQADRSTSAFPNGRSRTTVLSPRVSWRRPLGRRGWMQGAVTGRGEDVMRSLLGGQLAEVSEERHRVDHARSLQLERVNADAGSVVVRSADQSRTYTEPMDYRALVVGPVVRLQFPAGSRIATGDIIVVTYRYLVLEGAPFRILGSGVEASFGFPWIHGRYNATHRSVLDRPSATPKSAEQGTDELLGLGVTTGLGAGHLDVEIERRRRTGSIADYAVREARLLFLPESRATLTTSLGATVTHTTSAGDEVVVLAGNTALAWAPTSAFRLQASLDSWSWRFADLRPERFTGLSLLTSWKLGQLETEWRYGYQLRAQGVRGVEQRTWARVVRHF